MEGENLKLALREVGKLIRKKYETRISTKEEYVSTKKTNIKTNLLKNDVPEGMACNDPRQTRLLFQTGKYLFFRKHE